MVICSPWNKLPNPIGNYVLFGEAKLATEDTFTGRLCHNIPINKSDERDDEREATRRIICQCTQDELVDLRIHHFSAIFFQAIG